MDKPNVDEILDKIATVQADIDQAQSWIDNARKIGGMNQAFLDQAQYKLDDQQAELNIARRKALDLND